MSNSKQPAFPLTFDAETIREINKGFKEQKLGRLQLEGLTKREYFAAKAMQGFIAAGSQGMPDNETIVTRAISCADELLKQLSA